MFEPKMIENENSFQCIHKHNLPIIKVAFDVNLPKDKRLLCEQCVQNNITDSKLVDYQEIVKIIKSEQLLKMNQVETIINTNINQIQILLDNVYSLKTNVIDQLDFLASTIKELILNLELRGLQYSEYSFIDQLDSTIKKHNVKFDPKSLFNDIFSDYTNWKPKITSILELFNNFEQVKECHQSLSNVNLEIQKQILNNQSEKSYDIIEGVIDLRKYCNINTFVSQLILSPNEQYLVVILQQNPLYDKAGEEYIQNYLIIVINLINIERIYEGEWFEFDYNADDYISFKIDQNSKYLIDMRHYNTRIVKFDSIDQMLIQFQGYFLNIDINQNIYMLEGNQVKVYQIADRTLLRIYALGDKLIWAQFIQGYAFIIKKYYFQIVLLQNLKQIKRKFYYYYREEQEKENYVLKNQYMVEELDIQDYNEEGDYKTRTFCLSSIISNKKIRQCRKSNCKLFQNGFEAWVSWMEDNQILKFDLFRGTQKVINFTIKDNKQRYAVGKNTIVKMMKNQKLKYQILI